MPCATALRHVTIGGTLSLIYGPGTLFIRDVAITSLVPRNALNGGVFHPPAYLFSFLCGLGLYCAYIPAFRWSLLQDAFRHTQTQWSLSLDTLLLLNGFYTHAVYFLAQVLLMQEKPFNTLAWEAFLVLPSSLIMTAFAEAIFLISFLQKLLVMEFAE